MNILRYTILIIGFLGIQWLAAQEGVVTVTDFSVPEYDDDGNITSELLGDYADIYPDGKIRVRNLRIDAYKDNQVNMSVTSPECEYVEADKQAHSTTDVRITQENMVLTGKGFSWIAADERLVIDSDVKVVLKNVKKRVKIGEKK